MLKMLVRTLCIAVALGSVVNQLSIAADWPCWRGPNHDAKCVETGLRTDWDENAPTHVWTTEGFGRGYASVSIVDGRLYTTGNFEGEGQGVIAASADTGEILWKKILTDSVPKHGYVGSRCTPTVDGEYLYIVTSNGDIACLRTVDGSEVWTKDFADEWNGKMMSGWGFSESPLVDGDHVLCTPGGPEAMIVCLNKKTGEEVWKTGVPDFGGKGKDGAGYSSIVISEAAGLKQYVQLIGRGVFGVRASDGKFLWGYNKVANDVANIPNPIPFGDYVFASTGYGTGACLLHLTSAGSGAINAEEVYFLDAKTFQNHHGGMILHGGYVYAGTKHNKGFPTCLDVKSGEIKWGGEIRGEGSGSAAVLFADGHLIFRYQSGDVALIEATPEGYNLKGSFMPVYQEDKSWAHPVIVDGKLYLREQNKLMCYDMRADS